MALDGSGTSDARGVFDFGQLALISAGDADFEREIAGEYFAQARQLFAEIARARESGDFAALKRAAHTLKGSSLTVGAAGVGAAAAELERLAASPDPAKMAQTSARARALLAATEGMLDGHFGTDSYRKTA